MIRSKEDYKGSVRRDKYTVGNNKKVHTYMIHYDIYDTV